MMGGALRASGTWEGGVAAVAPAIEPPAAATALYAALAAPLLGIVEVGQNPVLDWSGPTSTGKTTLLSLAASVWGEPGGLIATWDITPTKMERLCAFLADLPVFLD